MISRPGLSSIKVIHDSQETETYVEGKIQSLMFDGKEIHDLHVLNQSITRVSWQTKIIAGFCLALTCITIGVFYNSYHYNRHGLLATEKHVMISKEAYESLHEQGIFWDNDNKYWDLKNNVDNQSQALYMETRQSGLPSAGHKHRHR